jgi:uncharacterized protein (TIGR03663 family)
MKPGRAYGLTLAVILAAAAALRLPGLTERPLHADESVHAYKLGELLETGDYQYDRHEFHGPTLYYAAAPFALSHGAHRLPDLTERDLRLTTILFGLLLVAAVALLADGLGRGAVLLAAALLAGSPALIYFSRYFIQEMPFVTFAMLLIGCAWRYHVSRRRAWAAAAGVALGLLWATKETALITLAAAGLAYLLARRPWARDRAPRASLPLADAGLVIVLAVIVAAAFLSGFGRHPRAMIDLLASYVPWAGRLGGGEAEAAQPWWYYLRLLVYAAGAHGPRLNETPIVLLAAAGAWLALARPAWLPRACRPGLARFVAWDAILLLAVYSAIPYKMPWLVLSALSMLALLGGLAGAAAIERWRATPLPAALLAVLLLVLYRHAYLLNFPYNTDNRVAYAFSQTGADMLDFAEPIEQMQRQWAGPGPFVVKLKAPDKYVWPLPWYLRRIVKVDFNGALPDDYPAQVIIAWATKPQPGQRDPTEARLEDDYQQMGFAGLRRGVIIATWVRNDVWQRYMADRRAVRRPG